MKKILGLVLAAVTMAFSLIPAQATTLSPAAFNVKVNLTAICTVVTPPGDVNFGVYTAFTGAATPAPTTTVDIQCTRGLTAPTYSFDAGLGGNDGVIAGLNYTLAAASTGSTAGTSASVGPVVAGTAATRTITITGGMAASQAGECAGTAAACAGVQSQARTLTITY